MFEYDEFYNLLFKNPKFINVLLKFHVSSWAALDEEGRKGVIKEFIDVYCETFGIDDMKIKMSSSKKNSGFYDDYSLVVNVSENAIKTGNQYDIMDTLFHEARHNFQKRAIAKRLSELEQVDEKKIKEWKMNFLRSPRGFSNYIYNEDEAGYLYLYQPVEEDAFKTAMSLTRISYQIIETKLGLDVNFYRYCVSMKNHIMTCFSKEEDYVKYFKEKRGEVFEHFKKNNKGFALEKKCMKVAKEIMKKEIKDMSLEEICSLFSVYVWAYLDDDYKVGLLEEYDSRINKYKKVEIKRVNNSYFKIGKHVIEKNDILNLLNILMTVEFKRKVDAIVNGKEDVDENLREELRLNMFKKDRKYINYIEDYKNPITYLLQPYSLLEGKFIGGQFKFFRECEINSYGVDEGDYNWMIDYYNYDKFKPYLEGFYEEPFDSVYKKSMDKMRENIKILTTKKI